jgi:hypothetical protein
MKGAQWYLSLYNSLNSRVTWKLRTLVNTRLGQMYSPSYLCLAIAKTLLKTLTLRKNSKKKKNFKFREFSDFNRKNSNLIKIQKKNFGKRISSWLLQRFFLCVEKEWQRDPVKNASWSVKSHF